MWMHACHRPQPARPRRPFAVRRLRRAGRKRGVFVRHLPRIGRSFLSGGRCVRVWRPCCRRDPPTQVRRSKRPRRTARRPHGYRRASVCGAGRCGRPGAAALASPAGPRIRSGGASREALGPRLGGAGAAPWAAAGPAHTESGGARSRSTSPKRGRRIRAGPASRRPKGAAGRRRADEWGHARLGSRGASGRWGRRGTHARLGGSPSRW